MVGSEAMLDEEHPPVGFQHAADLLERPQWIGDAAEHPGSDRRVDRAVIEKVFR
jgi:hypothetical protein